MTTAGKDRSSSYASRSSSPKRDEGFSRFLKPGALAQLRNSKIIAKSHRPSLTLLPLQPTQSTAAAGDNSPSAAPYSDVVPCFVLRTSTRARCPQRKKLLAVAPIFAESQS